MAEDEGTVQVCATLNTHYITEINNTVTMSTSAAKGMSRALCEQLKCVYSTGILEFDLKLIATKPFSTASYTEKMCSITY